jgi:7-keto-8-aminopelargonate synthetase-like enzyme
MNNSFHQKYYDTPKKLPSPFFSLYNESCLHLSRHQELIEGAVQLIAQDSTGVGSTLNLAGFSSSSS